MKKLLVTSLIAATAISFGQAGRPTGDLIAVQRADEQVGGAVRTLSYQSVVAGLGPQVKRTLADGRIVVVRPPKGKSWQQHRRTLLDSGMFDSVEPDTYVMPCGTVNDPNFPNQWHLNAISVQRAWDFTRGGNRIVAVVDGGVDLTHPDLIANLVPGYNVLTSQTQVSGGVVSDVRTNGHGTRIAGVAAAVGNNGIGVSGVGPNLKIMPIRVTDDASQGAATRSNLLAGGEWAVQSGATAVNVSYTGVENEDVEAMGVYARSQGAFLVWAAGNANTDWLGFDHQNVTVVGGVNASGTLWTSGSQGSGYGRGVDVFAPCTQVFTTSKGGGYGNAPAGTSFAVPQVAASLALMRDRFPYMSPSQIEKELLYRSSNLGTKGFDVTYSHGQLSVGKGVENNPLRYKMVEIPFPATVITSIAISLNNHGVVIGHATVTGSSFPVSWKFSETEGFSFLTPPTPWQEVSVRRINDAGQIAGVLYSPTSGPNSIQGFVLEPSGEYTFYSTILKPNSHVNDIADDGYAVGWEYIDGSTNIDGIGWVNSSSPTYFLGGSYIPDTREFLISVNRYGQAVGQLGNANNGGVVHSFETNYNNYLSAPITYNAWVTQINDLGWISGYVNDGSTRAARWRVRRGEAFDFQRSQFSVDSAGWSVNNAGDLVGYEGSFMYLFTGLQPGRVDTMLAEELPSRFRWLQNGREINDSGEIVGYGRKVNDITEGVYLKPQFEAAVGVSIGQLGESPTYIGSIPPALSVTFTDAAGTPYPNSTVNLNYNGPTGRLDLETPPDVNGPYRIFLRCSSTAIPGYDGPTFLSRMYPHLGEPAAPVGTSFLPFDGPLINGSPVILMYAGDVDDSGEIDAADIDIVIAKFGLVNGDDDWNYAIDVDGTGEIDAADIDLVIANFGLTGDPEP